MIFEYFVINVPILNNSDSILLDRMAILKAFAPTTMTTTTMMTIPSGTIRSSSSKFEKPTSAREAAKRRRRQRSKHRQSLSSTTTTPVSYDPAVEEEFLRLRDSVPSIAGQSNVTDLTIINEAISLICDLESQLLNKLCCQSLPELRQQFFK
ncbi:hypothetical protein DERP_009180 [Dermatophagoides pteronyssinus]|uniref:BHLH domain-containing protein n=1 Tax=Dermatophagoides pteronyssinus TaxID=6956 RepID=A0ABQ8JQR2_DERPT|nr:hypothetical protein DERP_009180 [Dermatophagoides pteronyssinus]